MRKPIYDIAVFKERRQKLAAKMQNAALVIPAHPHFIRNNDCEFPFRQDTNLLYLTGFDEPEAVLVFRPGCDPETTLFVLPKNKDMEIWNGFRYGAEDAKDIFGVDQTYTTDKLETELPKLLGDVDDIYYSMFSNQQFDQLMLRVLKSLSLKASRSNTGHLPVKDPKALIGELRIKKTDFDIQQMRKACQISAESHIEVMKACKPGITEMALEGVFLKAMMERGCPRVGYNSILAGGANACTLHYVFNDAELKDGEMLLIDAGAEWKYYSGDITRSYPINGKFNPAQRDLYSSILDIQKRAVDSVKPGNTREGIQKQVVSEAVDLMLNMNLLKGSKVAIIENKEYMKYYMHGVSHWLGKDVHDAGVINKNGEPRPFEEGFCLTIEPGLYIPADDENAPAELRGTGIRIEDDILVTANGHENMTAACPKEVDELEAIIGR